MINPYYSSKEKRIFDIAIALVGLTLGMPVFIVVAALVKFGSRGPILFRQIRIGKDRRQFTIYKFRTMYLGAHKDQKKFRKLNTSAFPTFKIHDDPRFVGAGRFLSQYSLDELPQLVNVLLGEMSVVGPRPFPVGESQQIPKVWLFRYNVKPGLISNWLLVPRDQLSTKKWTQLDKLDLQHASIGSDLMLVLRVIFSFLR